MVHLYRNGFNPRYFVWIDHGESDGLDVFICRKKKLGRTPIEPEVFKKTHVRKKENESDPDVWVEERAERTFNDFHQYVAENLDSSVQLAPELSTQIWKEKVLGGTHKAALAESERRRVAEQERMSETVQQIKEQVMNLTRRPTTSAPDDTTTRVMRMIM
ncbi:hypothetical protein MTR67_046606 [Solanum verrucosum]|uniref:Transposase-associated domain-containing protein n=1 Tax=Solanum verrucosum TaxID=315347 RepID=A0AAF0ZVN4_SOLVR|nr:hypothetical protein MTR67_046606 [Solanum verrucosum]